MVRVVRNASLCLFLITAISVSTSAQSGSGAISGTVTRSDGSSAVQGAAVTVFLGSTQVAVAITDRNGNYSIDGLRPGTYSLRVSAPRFVAKQHSSIIVGPQPAVANVSLDVAPAATNTVTYRYDDLGRLTQVADSAGNLATYTYDPAGNILSISRQTTITISIIDFNPKIGPPGTAVTIIGSGFSATASQNTVSFNGASATISSATTSQIITSVPAGASSGAITVTSPIGSATSSTAFTVTAPIQPAITGFSPQIGVVGTAVTMTGSNFDASISNNQVTFNGVPALISSNSTTSISTTVPSGAGSGRISLTTPLGKAVSTDIFFVVPPPLTAANIETTGQLTVGVSTTFSFSATDSRGLPTGKGLFVFDGAAGQRITLVFAADKAMMSGRFSVFKPDGTALTQGFFGASASVTDPSLGAFLTSMTTINSLPVTGTYSILVSPFLAGKLTLTQYAPVDASGTIAAGGPPVTVTTTVPGQNAQVTFDGSAGQRVSLQISNLSFFDAFPDPFSGTHVSISVCLRSPSGSTLACTSVSDQFGGVIAATTLATSGTYSIFIDPISYFTGSLALKLFNVVDATASTTVGGPAATVNYSAPGQTMQVSFSGSQGQRLTLKWAFSDPTKSSSASILAPGGASIASGPAVGSGIGFLDFGPLPASGIYTIVIRPADTSVFTSGSFTLNLTENPADSLGAIMIDGPPVTVTTSVATQDSRLSFSGTAGQRICVLVTNATFNPALSILNPDGSTLATFSVFLGPTSLPATGTYTILVDPFGYDTGSVTLTLYQTPADVTGAITVGGPAVSVTTATAGQKASVTFTPQAGVRLALQVSFATAHSPSVTVLAPDGTTLAGPAFILSGTSFNLVFTPAVTGVHTIVVTLASSDTGSVTLTLFQVPADVSGSITVGGPPVTVSLLPGQHGQLNFTVGAGQTASLSWTGDSSISVTVDGIFRGSGATGAIGPVLAGGHTVSLSGSGSVTLTLIPAPPTVTGTITPGGPPLTVAIPIPTQPADISFNGNHGERIAVLISNTSTSNFSIGISDQGFIGGTISSRAGDANGFIDTLVLPLTGTGDITINGTGSITLTMLDVPPDVTSGAITPGGPPVTVTTTSPGQNAVLPLTGAAGQQITVHVTGNTVAQVAVRLVKADGIAVAGSTSGSASFSFSCTLPLTGQYTVVVDPVGPATGSLTVALTTP